MRYPAMASRNFVIFWVGQFISLIGTWMQSVTQPYLAYRLTGSAFDLGLIGFAGALPTLLLALPGGVLVERLDKRKTVIAMQAVMLVQAFLMAFLALTGVIQVWHIALLSFLLGAASAIEITARQAMLIELVGKEALPNAIAMQSMIFNAARVLGPSLAAPFLILIKGGGEGWAFFANGISYFFIIISLFYVQTPFKTERLTAARDWVADFLEGQNYIRQTRMVAMIIVMAGVLGFIAYPLMNFIPVLARDVLTQNLDSEAAVAARTSAIFTAQGVGALIASLVLATFNTSHKGWLMASGQFVFITSLLATAFVHNVPIELALFVLIGWGSVITLACMNTMIQLEVPDHLRGRVFATYLWGLQGITPFGSLLVGWMAQTRDVLWTTLVCALICLLVIGAIQLFNPQIRERAY